MLYCQKYFHKDLSLYSVPKPSLTEKDKTEHSIKFTAHHLLIIELQKKRSYNLNIIQVNIEDKDKDNQP